MRDEQQESLPESIDKSLEVIRESCLDLAFGLRVRSLTELVSKLEMKRGSLSWEVYMDVYEKVGNRVKCLGWVTYEIEKGEWTLSEISDETPTPYEKQQRQNLEKAIAQQNGIQ